MKNYHIYSIGGLLIVGLFYVLARILGVEASVMSGVATFVVTICVLVLCFGEDY